MKESFNFKPDRDRTEFEMILENGRQILRKMRAEEEQAIEDEAKFTVEKETEYGPHLVRVKKDQKPPIAKQAVETVVVKSPSVANNTEKVLSTEMTRRSFVGALGLGAVGVGLSRFEARNEAPSAEGDVEEGDGAVITPEAYSESPQFFDEVSGFEARAKLRFDEVQFVDEANRPLGGPVKLEAFTINRNGKPYLLSPGPTDEVGILTDGIAGEWLSEMRDRLREEYPGVREIKALSVVANFRAALNDSDEPALVSGIANGSICTYQDVIAHFGNKPVIGAENYSRKEYVQKKIRFHYNPKNGMGAPPPAQAELRKIVPGLCMQESGFNNDLTSRTGARGIFQFQPVTWKEQGGEPEEISSLKKQTELAGNYLSQLYWQVQHFAGDEAMEILKETYDEESLAKDVLVPLTINAYNAGASRVGAAVKEYFSHAENRDKRLAGKDLYIDIANFALEATEGKLQAYGDDAREYVTRIYGNAAALSSV